MRVAIYTSITASVDSLKGPIDHAGEELVIFSDQPRHVPGWLVRDACDLFKDPRRNSRAPKILAHQYLSNFEYSLWLDGSMRLRVPVQELVSRYLRDADIALFRHPDRCCVYEEAVVCADRNLDDPDVISNQMSEYRRNGYPENSGLHEAGVILRRHSKSIETFNNAWWSEMCRHSCRDQLSLDYVLHATGICPAIIEDHHGYRDDRGGPVAYEGHLMR